jgi:putative nucleotidyltransferase with HDIG domain
MATAPTKAPEKPQVWRPDEVPPFPAVALNALNLIAGTDTSLIELCNLIRPDVAFSTEILRIANSPLIAFSKDVTSVLQASMLLGFRRLRSIVVTVGLKAYLANQYSPLLRACWHHSLACAIIAERAAKACGHDKDAAYTAGIMHDVGRMVLAISQPAAYALVVEHGADQPRDLLETEHAFCGVDHCKAGRMLVKEWALPETLSWITACHHDADIRTSGVDSLVSRSCLLADTLGFAVVRFRAPQTYEQVLIELPELSRSAFPADQCEAVSQIENEIRLIEA